MKKTASILISFSFVAQATAVAAQAVPAPPLVVPTLPAWSTLKSACVAPGRDAVPPVAEAIAQTAVDEATKFGGQKSVEGTWAILRGADFDRPENSFAWGRVYHYWKTAGALHLWNVRSPKPSPSGGLSFVGQAIQWNDKFDLAQTFKNLETASRMPGSPLTKWEAFTLQAEMVIPKVVKDDLPWSAVFISTVMAQAGLSKEQFKRAPSHATYIQQALGGLKGELKGTAYIACPPDPDVVLRVGDLVCSTRDRGRVFGFQDVWDKKIVASHCDVVVALAKESDNVVIVRVVGGNVSNTVLTKKLVSMSATPSLATIAPPLCEGGREACEWITVLKLQKNL